MSRTEKIILFSEYVDTPSSEKRFKSNLRMKYWFVIIKVSKDLARHLNSDFNTQYNRLKQLILKY